MIPLRPGRLARPCTWLAGGGLLATLLLAAPAAAQAPGPDAPIATRTGNHPAHGRVVFDWPQPPAFTVEHAEGRVTLRFPPAEIDLAGARRLPRNVIAVARTDAGIEVTLRPGATARVFRVGARVVVDAHDPAPVPLGSASTAGPIAAPTRRAQAPAGSGAAADAPAPRPPSTPIDTPRAPRPGLAETPSVRPAGAAAPAPPAAGAPVPAQAARIAPQAAAAAVRGAAPAPAPPPGPVSVPGPAPVPTPTPAALPEATPPPAPGPDATPAPVLPVAAALPVRARVIPGQRRALVLPFPAGTAVAVLRRGDALLAVFDHALPLDLAPLRRDPVFAGLETQTIPGATVLRLPLAAPAVLRLRRDGPAWLLEALHPQEAADDPIRAIGLDAEAGEPGRLALGVAEPGRSLAMTDPLSGLPLLLGTVQAADQAVLVGRRLPEFDLLETLLGVAVLARSEGANLRVAPDRFVLAAGTPLGIGPQDGSVAAAAAMTRSFDVPVLPLPALLERLRSQQAGIADTPPLARHRLRRDAAQTLLALGLPQEAQAMLALAATDDPRAAADPVTQALAGVAALLAGRTSEADAIAEAPLPPTDERTLWRAARSAALGDPAAAAPGLAATLPLLLGYPPALRQRLVPVAAETLAEMGAWAPLQRLLTAIPAADQPLPRGMAAEAAADPAAALGHYAAAADGRDRRARAAALRRAAELRLATGAIDAGQAARALEATLFAWRGDAEELTTRLRVAALRRAAGDPRGALALLRETEALFPEQAPRIMPAIRSAFAGAVQQEPPLAAIALHDAYPDLLAADAEGEAVIATLADRLAALDLAPRAIALLRDAAARAGPPERAALGLKLATLLLEEADPLGAGAALAATTAPDLPEALMTARTLLGARVRAATGDPTGAAAALHVLGPAGTEALVDILAAAQDWPSAAAAHAEQLAARIPPAPGPLDAAMARAAIRQAALLALAGDETALAGLRGSLGPRLPAGADRDAFTAMTAPQLRGLADLPRLQQELALFRTLPARLEALRAGAPLTR